MLTKKAKYGILALLALAREGGAGPLSISDIAEGDHIPKKFLELILLDLKNVGILQSKKGKGGGYSLGRPMNEIMLGQVIRILDGPLAPVPCVSKSAYRRCNECRDERTCGIRLVMKDVRDAISQILDQVSLADVNERVQKAMEDTSQGLMYHI